MKGTRLNDKKWQGLSERKWQGGNHKKSGEGCKGKWKWKELSTRMGDVEGKSSLGWCLYRLPWKKWNTTRSWTDKKEKKKTFTEQTAMRDLIPSHVIMAGDWYRVTQHCDVTDANRQGVGRMLASACVYVRKYTWVHSCVLVCLIHVLNIHLQTSYAHARTHKHIYTHDCNQDRSSLWPTALAKHSLHRWEGGTGGWESIGQVSKPSGYIGQVNKPGGWMGMGQLGKPDGWMGIGQVRKPGGWMGMRQESRAAQGKQTPFPLPLLDTR